MATESSILAALLKQQSISQQMAREAISTAPTPSWGAGIARALMGGIAGLNERGDRANRLADFDAEYGTAPTAPAPMPSGLSDALMGGGPGQPAPDQPTQPPPQRVATALSGPSATPSPAPPAAMGPMDSFPNRSGYSQNDKIISAVPDSGPNAGVNIAPDPFGQRFAGDTSLPPNATPTAGPAAQPPAAGVPQPQPIPPTPNVRQAPQIPPDVLVRARKLAASDDPTGPARAAALLEPYKTPKDQWTQVRPDLFINTASGEPKFGPIGTNVSLNAESKAESEYAKGKATDALGLERSADSTLAERQRLEVFKNLVQDFKTGKLAPAQSTIGAWADAIGIDPKKLGLPANAAINGQLIESLSNQMTLGMIGTKGGEGGGMPANNFSDADRKFLQNTVPGLARVQGGNLILTEIKARGLDRHLEKVSMWDDYRASGKSYETFERDWRKKVMNAPSLFADIPDQVRGMSAPGGGGEPPPASGDGGWKIEKVR